MSRPSDSLPTRDEQDPENYAQTFPPPPDSPQAEVAPDLPSPESELPPEARGEANGGPLGCCLGTVVGVFLGFLVIVTISLVLSNGGYLNIATLPVLLAGAGVCGYFGWKIGKRFYREYDPNPAHSENRRTRK